MEKNISVSDIIQKSPKLENVDIISSGIIPPDPTELLMSNRVTELFEELNSLDCDYVVVDTAPLSLVSDTMILSKYANTIIYVVRAHYLDKRMLDIPRQVYAEKRLPNISILLNGTDGRKGYGFGYGQKFDEMKNIPWWKRVFNS